jgi:tetraacyldisaccharide 4'-kinase
MRPYSALRRVIGPIVGPVYAWEVARRDRAFDAGKGVRRAPAPVISVGNLTTGGTGKTPMVEWLVRALLARGLVPAIALRGYRAHDGRSDEAEQYRRLLPGTPVLVGADRWASITDARARGVGFDCVVLDDGFQHRRLARDVDIVLVDAAARTPQDRLLPAGDLREPVASLARAQAVVITHADAVEQAQLEELCAWARGLLGEPRVVVQASHVWTGLRVHEAGQDREAPVTSLSGTRVVVVCGLGRPEHFIRQAQGVGVHVVHQLLLGDHAMPTAAQLDGVRRAAKAHGARLLTTGKDWARMRACPAQWQDLPVVRPMLGLRLAGEVALIHLIVGKLPPSAAAMREDAR